MGTAPLYRCCMSLYVPLVILFPIVHQIGLVDRNLAFAGVLLIGLLKATAATVFACVMILVNTAAPSRTSLGRVNGAAQTCAAMMRTIGPTSASSLFALSNQKKLAGGLAVYFALGALALVSAISTFYVEEGLPSEQKVAEDEQEEEA